mgnify:FL=1
MNFFKLSLIAIGMAIGMSNALEVKIVHADEQFIPLLVYRTGAYAPSGIPLANGFNDYYNLINKRDGGINGVKITMEECKTKYNKNNLIN